jgi:hypothetical protein
MTEASPDLVVPAGYAGGVIDKEIRMLAGLVAALMLSGAAAPPAATDDGVTAPLNAYLKGHQTGQREHFEAAFHPEAQLFGVRNGKFLHESAKAYIARASSGQAAADEAQRKRWIKSINVTGDVAVAEIILDYPTMKATDVMTLVKSDGRWLIVNKSYVVTNPPRPAP